MMPLYEAKMLHLYDTRWATYEFDGSTRLMTEDEKAAHTSPMPRYWVAEAEIDKKLGARWDQSWFLGWRDIARTTDERTTISTMLPRVACGNKIPVAMPRVSQTTAAALQATLSSFALDYAARQKLGGSTMNYFIFMQLPVPHPEQLESHSLPLDRPFRSWVSSRVDRLNGWIADPTVRAQVRAELDAASFHVYGLGREDVSYVMSTFPIVKRKDEATYGSYRTCELILAAYDAMSEAKATGQPYRAPWSQEVPA